MIAILTLASSASANSDRMSARSCAAIRPCDWHAMPVQETGISKPTTGARASTFSSTKPMAGMPIPGSAILQETFSGGTGHSVLRKPVSMGSAFAFPYDRLNTSHRPMAQDGGRLIPISALLSAPPPFLACTLMPAPATPLSALSRQT